jgi:t-SNARE complex subunit (syntaxin)
LQHEAKFQEAVINENQDNLDMIEGMMGDMVQIQEKTKTELVKQTEDLVKIVENTDVVVENVELAHVEIVKAEKHQSSTGKCVLWIVGLAIVVVIVVIIIIVV